ncbi:MAG: Gfo/Idh/MocA family oxidoreductase [Gammaproteobacteria bacterium]|jgi:predicted dehydrogenase|nr:Gfo/Idh/MocA family oxidoreductase [Gammaproteobacteria bacterium]
MTKKPSATRRDFLKKSAAASALAASSVPYFSWSEPVFANNSPNDRPNIGCIGTGSMGSGDAIDHGHFGNIVAVCDVDSRRSEKAKHHDRIGKGKADAYKDYRKVLDRDDIDTVSIVTPDHWHIKIAVEALQAGKHVFCQKPLTLTLEENKIIRDACKKHDDQIFFVGTQQRSSRRLFMRAVNMVQKGLLGDIQKVTVGIDGSPTGGPFPLADAPKELDWEMWLGQAPLVDYREKRCHYQFRWWYEYSGGKFTDWGAHHVDIATWALQQDQEGMGPVEIDGTAAVHPVDYKDGHATVDDHYNASHDFSIPCRFANGVEMVVTSKPPNGVLFEGTKGRMFVNRGKIVGKPIDEDWDAGHYGQDDLTRLYKGKPHEWHKANFYRSIRDGGLPVSDVFSHVQAMNTCHLCTIAARLGRKIQWDPAAEQIVGDELAASFVSRTPRAGYEIPRV